MKRPGLPLTLKTLTPMKPTFDGCGLTIDGRRFATLPEVRLVESESQTIGQEIARTVQACHGLAIPEAAPPGILSDAVAFVSDAERFLRKWESSPATPEGRAGLALMNEARRILAALTPADGLPVSPPAHDDTPADRRPVWSFEVDGQHVRWCGTLDQWHKDRMEYCNASGGEWVLLNTHALRFVEPRNPDGSKGQVTVFKAVNAKEAFKSRITVAPVSP